MSPSRDRWRQRRPFNRLAPALCAVSLAFLAPLRAAELDVRVESRFGAELRTVLKKSAAPGLELFDVSITNSDPRDVTLGAIVATLQIDHPIRDGTPYMIGADAQEPDGQMEQLVAGKPAANDFSNMYVMLQRGKSDYLLVGLISWRTFLCKVFVDGGSIRIEGDGDRRRLPAGEEVAFEKIVSLQGASWQDLLDRYADLIVRENRVAPPPSVDWRGWSTWDYYARNFRTDDVRENVRAMEALGVPMNIIQLDGGWWPERGDYLAAREDLRGGIKSLADDIHRAGYKVGLHFDGFRAAKSAAIVKEHPEYFLRADDGQLLEIKPNAREGFLVWDYSHPGALAYIRQVMKNARENWGVDYFKIDFMRNGLTPGRSHLPITSLERFRQALRAMREGMGLGAYFLACGANFGPVIGLVDGNRTAQDIHPNFQAVRTKAKHNSGSYYLHRRVFNVDSDYVVLRSQEESDERDRKRPSLTVAQGAMWADYVAIHGNARFESDKVLLLGPEKRENLRRCFALPFFKRTIPLDLWDHYKIDIDAPRVFLSEAEDGQICLGIFNWDDTELSFSISGFDSDGSFHELKGVGQHKSDRGKLAVTLKGTQSILLGYSGKSSFDQLRHSLQIQESFPAAGAARDSLSATALQPAHHP